MTHFVGGPLHGTPVPFKQQMQYRIMSGRVHYIRRVAPGGRVDYPIYGMLETNVEKLLAEIYSTEDV